MVLHHAGADWLPGGFTGVDLFFVISGYLITGRIVGDLASGRFSLLAFFEARVRRIVPALAVMLAVTAFAAWLVQTPEDFRRLAAALAAAAVFASNLLFARGEDYFATSEARAPLVHTWTLGVEEQFYLLWPLALIALWRWKRRAVPPAIVLLLAGSFALACLLARSQPLANFYLLPTRLWELQAGAACALCAGRLVRLAGARPRLGSAGALAGLALSGAGLVLISPESPVPGPWSLLPVGGAVLVILCAGPANAVGRLLAWRPLVMLGLGSYGTYLWHQPILALLEYVWLAPVPPAVLTGAVALAFVLGHLSFRLVEEPVRRRRVLARRGVLALTCGVPLAALLAAGIAGHYGHLRPRSHALAERLGGIMPLRLGQSRPAPGEGPLPFILYGDSHAWQYYEAMVARFGRGDMVAMPACLSAPGLTNMPGAGATQEACRALPERLLERLAERPAPVVVWAQVWNRDLVTWPPPERPAREAEIERAIVTLAERLPAGTRLLLVGNVPTPRAAGERMAYGYLRCSAYFDAQCPPDYPAELAEARARNGLLQRIAAAHPRIAYADPAGSLCRAARCLILDRGRLLYWDGQHLTTEGARRVVATFDSALFPGPGLP